MKIGITVGETMDGKWEVLALPDKQVQDQKVMFKALQVADGALKSGKVVRQFKKIYFFDSAAKHAKCDPDAKQRRIDAERAVQKVNAERAVKEAGKAEAAAKAALEAAEAKRVKAESELKV